MTNIDRARIFGSVVCAILAIAIDLIMIRAEWQRISSRDVTVAIAGAYLAIVSLVPQWLVCEIGYKLASRASFRTIAIAFRVNAFAYTALCLISMVPW